jgi:hypothetical protein
MLQMVSRIQNQEKRLQRLRPTQLINQEKAHKILETPENLMDFIPAVSPAFGSPLHLAPVVQKVQKAHLEPIKVAFHVPPQHYKSSTILHGIAYWMKQKRDLSILYGTYNQTQANHQILKAQTYVERVGFTPDPRMANIKDYQILEGGNIHARGREVGFTGLKGDIIAIDDLYKNRAEAMSPAVRKETEEFFTDVVQTRTHEGSSIIVFFTRWVENDLIGFIAKHFPEFEIIRIPAMADGMNALGTGSSPDPVGRDVGEPLLPHVKSKESLQKLKNNPATLQTYLSLYQGLPRDDKTRIFQNVYYYDELPQSGYRIVCAMDGAYTKKKSADQSVFMLARATGYGENTVVYLEYVYAVRATSSEFFKAIKPFSLGHSVRWRGSGTETGVADLAASEIGINMNFSTTSENKLGNAQGFAKAWNEGRILLPDPSKFDLPWINEMVEQVHAFTGVSDEADDFVDCGGNLYDAATLIGEEIDAGQTLSMLKGFAKK